MLPSSDQLVTTVDPQLAPKAICAAGSSPNEENGDLPVNDKASVLTRSSLLHCQTLKQLQNLQGTPRVIHLNHRLPHPNQIDHLQLRQHFLTYLLCPSLPHTQGGRWRQTATCFAAGSKCTRAFRTLLFLKSLYCYPLMTANGLSQAWNSQMKIFNLMAPCVVVCQV